MLFDAFLVPRSIRLRLVKFFFLFTPLLLSICLYDLSEKDYLSKVRTQDLSQTFLVNVVLSCNLTNKTKFCGESGPDQPVSNLLDDLIRPSDIECISEITKKVIAAIFSSISVPFWLWE